jgi:hypothetical protein
MEAQLDINAELAADRIDERSVLHLDGRTILHDRSAARSNNFGNLLSRHDKRVLEIRHASSTQYGAPVSVNIPTFANVLVARKQP